ALRSAPRRLDQKLVAASQIVGASAVLVGLLLLARGLAIVAARSGLIRLVLMFLRFSHLARAAGTAEQHGHHQQCWSHSRTSYIGKMHGTGRLHLGGWASPISEPAAGSTNTGVKISIRPSCPKGAGSPIFRSASPPSRSTARSMACSALALLPTGASRRARA